MDQNNCAYGIKPPSKLVMFLLTRKGRRIFLAVSFVTLLAVMALPPLLP